jgi:cystathionine beta-lyase family protein involved in aluminum resistance
VYKSIVFGAPAPSSLLYWNMAERFGWTLEYVKGLPVSTLHEFIGIEDGKAMARKSRGEK